VAVDCGKLGDSPKDRRQLEGLEAVKAGKGPITSDVDEVKVSEAQRSESPQDVTQGLWLNVALTAVQEGLLDGCEQVAKNMGML